MKEKMNRKELKRLLEVMRQATDLDLELLEDLSYSWKEACENLRLLRDDRRISRKLLREIYR